MLYIYIDLLVCCLIINKRLLCAFRNTAEAERQLTATFERETIELKHTKRKLIERCKELQKRVSKLEKIQAKKESELEKKRIQAGLMNEFDVGDGKDDFVMDNTFVVGAYGKVTNMGDCLYDRPDTTGKYIQRIEAGSMIRLSSVVIAPNEHNVGLMIQVQHDTTKAWIGLENTTFAKSSLW